MHSNNCMRGRSRRRRAAIDFLGKYRLWVLSAGGIQMNECRMTVGEAETGHARIPVLCGISPNPKPSLVGRLCQVPPPPALFACLATDGAIECMYGSTSAYTRVGHIRGSELRHVSARLTAPLLHPASYNVQPLLQIQRKEPPCPGDDF